MGRNKLYLPGPSSSSGVNPATHKLPSPLAKKKKGGRRVWSGRGSGGTLGFWCSRRFIFFPGMPKAGQNVATWWIELLISLATYAMTLLLDTLKASGSNNSTKVIGGAVIRLALGPEDLLVDTPLCKSAVSETASSASITFRQGICKKVRMRVVPQSEVGKRSGTLFACITPATDVQVAEELKSAKTEVSTLDELRSQPGAVAWPATGSRTINLRFGKNDDGSKWVDLGTQGIKVRTYDGGAATFILWVGYESLASVKSDAIKDNYDPGDAVFACYVEGYVRLRECDQGVKIRPSPLVLTDPSKVGWSKNERQRYDLSDAVMDSNGMFTQAIVSLDTSPSSSPMTPETPISGALTNAMKDLGT